MMHDPNDVPQEASDAYDEAAGADRQQPKPRSRGGIGDPAFGLLLALAFSIGLVPLLPQHADLRYTLAWGALAVVSVLTWLLGNADRIGQEVPENVLWGIGFGVLISTPFTLFFFGTFGSASRLMFPDLNPGTVLAFLVFVMPLAETLFFRGLLQRHLAFWIVGGLGGIWSVVLFFPVMWNNILESPVVAIFLTVALFLMSLVYSYVRERNGLAAAWLSQIVANFILFFITAL